MLFCTGSLTLVVKILGVMPRILDIDNFPIVGITSFIAEAIERFTKLKHIWNASPLASKQTLLTWVGYRHLRGAVFSNDLFVFSFFFFFPALD
jgi:hypothetical protein